MGLEWEAVWVAVAELLEVGLCVTLPKVFKALWYLSCKRSVAKTATSLGVVGGCGASYRSLLFTCLTTLVYSLWAKVLNLVAIT